MDEMTFNLYSPLSWWCWFCLNGDEAQCLKILFVFMHKVGTECIVPFIIRWSVQCWRWQASMHCQCQWCRRVARMVVRVLEYRIKSKKKTKASEYIVGFWVTIPCSVIGSYSGCWWTYCLPLHVKSMERRTYICTKCWYPPTRLCGVTTHTTTMNTFKTMKNTQILYRHKHGTHY